MTDRTSKPSLQVEPAHGAGALWFAPALLTGSFLLVVVGLLWLLQRQSLPGEIWGLALMSAGLAVGMAWAMIALRRDIKARIRSEEALKIREMESRRLVEQLSLSNEDLEQFAYVASHDLQEPLHKVRSFTELLMKNHAACLDETGRDYLERMHGASVRMQQMIENLLDLSRVTTRAEPFKPVDLGKIFNDVVSDLEIVIKKQGAVVLTGKLPVIEADPSQMQQLFANLINNGLKYHGDEVKPVIRVYCEESEEYVRILMEDNGIGFEEKYTERIFLPFERLHGRGRYTGLGIGLAICRKIVRRHGGYITARSSPGQGSVFIVHLPREHPLSGIVETT